MRVHVAGLRDTLVKALTRSRRRARQPRRARCVPPYLARIRDPEIGAAMANSPPPVPRKAACPRVGMTALPRPCDSPRSPPRPAGPTTRRWSASSCTAATTQQHGGAAPGGDTAIRGRAARWRCPSPLLPLTLTSRRHARSGCTRHARPAGALPAGPPRSCANVGTAVAPTTRAQYAERHGAARRSSSRTATRGAVADLVPDATARTGWGGRIADLLTC